MSFIVSYMHQMQCENKIEAMKVFHYDLVDIKSLMQKFKIFFLIIELKIAGFATELEAAVTNEEIYSLCYTKSGKGA